MRQKGFTLIELLLVLAILVALMGIVIFSLRPEIILTDNKEVIRKADVQNIDKAIRNYYIKNRAYPSALSTLDKGVYDICEGSISNCTVNGVSLEELKSSVLLSEIPVDPDCELVNDTCYDLDFDPYLKKYKILLPQDAVDNFNNLYGGSAQEDQGGSINTFDDHILLSGSTLSSASGDVSGTNNGQTDAWLVKTDNLGNMVWEKNIGGQSNDYASKAIELTDGNYFFAGTSQSSAYGDITETTNGSQDYWIGVIDSNGMILWNKLYGGSSFDSVFDAILTNDGNILVVGQANSSATGDIVDVNAGGTDAWIVKFDISGNILWQKLYGGNLADAGTKILALSDGGYFVLGKSMSTTGGEITESTHGDYDYWLLKLDGDGNIEWQQMYGGTGVDNPYNILKDRNRDEYLLVGTSTSSANGDVADTTNGSYDCWIVKINGTGNILWQNLLGGSAIDVCTDVKQKESDGYIFFAESTSSQTGDVSDTNNGGRDFWVFTTNTSGVIQSSMLYGGSFDDLASSMINRRGDGYYLFGGSYSSGTGDVTDTGLAGKNYWVLKVDADGNI